MNRTIRIAGFAFPFLFTVSSMAAMTIIEKSDFASAHEAKKGKQTVVLGTLNEAGLRKLKSFADESVENIEIRLAGEDKILKLRGPIQGEKIEFGPFEPAVAQKIIKEINQPK